jgi:hypothetical protein
MTIHCECGEPSHFAGYEGGSPEHVYCKYCKGVLRIGARVALSPTAIDLERHRHEAHVVLHWKTTTVYMQARCSCGLQFPINGDNKTEVNCQCGNHFFCDPHLSLTKLSIAEAAKVNYGTPPGDDQSLAELITDNDND